MRGSTGSNSASTFRLLRACTRELRGLGVTTDPSNCDKASGQCGLSPVRDLAKVQSPPPSPTCQPGGLGTVPVEKFGKGNVKRKQKKAKAISLGEGEEKQGESKPPVMAGACILDTQKEAGTPSSLPGAMWRPTRGEVPNRQI